MRKLFFLLALLLTAPFAQAGVKIEHWNAVSGARVFFVETHALPILDVKISFAAGTVCTGGRTTGFAGHAAVAMVMALQHQIHRVALK